MLVGLVDPTMVLLWNLYTTYHLSPSSPLFNIERSGSDNPRWHDMDLEERPFMMTYQGDVEANEHHVTLPTSTSYR